MSKVKRTGDFESLEVTDGKVKIHQREPIKQKDNFYIDELPWTCHLYTSPSPRD